MIELLGTLVSLLLVYLVFAIVVSGIQEWWAHFRGQRGRFLLIGLCRLVNEEAVLDRLLQHPLIGSLYRDRAARGQPPSYVDPRNFALALADVVVRRASPRAEGSGTATSVAAVRQPPLTAPAFRDALQTLAEQRSSVARSLLPIVDRANGDLTVALGGIEIWFANGMDRVSGWYKGAAQRRLFVFGLLIAALGNVDTIALFRALNSDPALRTTYGQIAERVRASGRIGEIDVATLKDRPPTQVEWQDLLKGASAFGVGNSNARLPIGYACMNALSALPAPAQVSSASEQPANIDRETQANGTKPPQSPAHSAANAAGEGNPWQQCREDFLGFSGASWADWLIKGIGFVLTALAGVLGAPFWFTAMSKLVNLRGGGPPPARLPTT